LTHLAPSLPSLISVFNKYLLSAHYGPGIAFIDGDTMVKEAGVFLPHMGLLFLVGRQTLNP
jgi:hypothetical protein